MLVGRGDPAATKRVIENYLRGGVAAADEHVPELAGELFATEDLRGALRSFLSEGYGRARFAGR